MRGTVHNLLAAILIFGSANCNKATTSDVPVRQIRLSPAGRHQESGRRKGEEQSSGEETSGERKHLTCKDFNGSPNTNSLLPSEILHLRYSCSFEPRDGEICPDWIIRGRMIDVKALQDKTSVLEDSCSVFKEYQLIKESSWDLKRTSVVIEFTVPKDVPNLEITVEQSDDGEFCIQNHDCWSPEQECSVGKCSCPSGYVFLKNQRKCVPIIGRMFGQCNYTEQCNATGSICKGGQCQCPGNYWSDSDFHFCLPYSRGLYETCRADYNCKERDSASRCFSGICLCVPDFADQGGICQNTGRGLNEYCYSDSDCERRSENTSCQHQRCKCNQGYQEELGVCQFIGSGLGERCLLNSDCELRDGKTECNYRRCTCKDEFTERNGECHVIYYGLNSKCSGNRECENRDSTTRCLNGVCICKPGHIEETGVCVAIGPTSSANLHTSSVIALIMSACIFSVVGKPND